jgi:hypothetical protein
MARPMRRPPPVISAARATEWEMMSAMCSLFHTPWRRSLPPIALWGGHDAKWP